MKKSETEYRMVEHYIKSDGRIKYTSLGTIYIAVKTYRQMMWSFHYFLIYLFFSTTISFMMIESEVISYFWSNFCISFAFLICLLLYLQTLLKSVYLYHLQIEESKDVNIAYNLIRDIHKFQKLFGSRPEELGILGVAKRLTKEYHRDIGLRDKKEFAGNRTRDSKFTEMYGVASLFMPLNIYDDYYYSIKFGMKAPLNVPKFPYMYIVDINEQRSI